MAEPSGAYIDMSDREIRTAFSAVVIWDDQQSYCSVLSDDCSNELIIYCTDDYDNSSSEDTCSIIMGDNNEKHDTTTTTTTKFTAICSLLIGLLFGSFLQMSSLGTNFLLAQYNYQYTATDATTTTTTTTTPFNLDTIFSLVWSTITSVMGVASLVLIGNLIVLVSSYNNNNNKASNMIRNCVENYYSIGALCGVCGAWILTDICLGYKAHTIQSIIMLVMALAWMKIVVLCIGTDNLDTDDDNVDLKQSLLSKQTKQLDSFKKFSAPVRFSAITLGYIIGTFIVFSSLGSNFLLDIVYGDGTPNHILFTSWNVIITFSVVYNLMTSILAGAAIFLIRQLVTRSWQSVGSVKSNVLNELNSTLEVYMGAGALLGLNVNWLITDIILHMRLHSINSLFVVVAALAWCKLATRWTSPSI